MATNVPQPAAPRVDGVVDKREVARVRTNQWIMGSPGAMVTVVGVTHVVALKQLHHARDLPLGIRRDE